MKSEPGAGPHILIVEDNPANLLLTRATLQRAGYRIDAARSAEEAQTRIAESQPDAILMDIQLPGMDGLTLTRQLKADPETSGIVIVALTAHAMVEHKAQALAAGCDGYLTKPIDVATFATTLTNILQDHLVVGAEPEAGELELPPSLDSREKSGEVSESAGSDRSHHRSAAEILVVDDHPENVALLRAQLERVGYRISGAYSGQSGLELAIRDQPDLILLDVQMPGMNGLEVCRALKASPFTRTIPVVMLTALTGYEDKIRGLEAGADDFLSKPVDDAELLARVRSTLRAKRLVDELARRGDEMEEQAQELAKEKSRLHTILQSINDGVVTTDVQGRVTSLNEAAERITGVTQQEAEGRLWHEAFGAHTANGQVLEQERSPLVEAARTGRPVQVADLQLYRADGRVVQLWLEAAPISQANGATAGAVGVLRDMTSQRAAQRRIDTDHAVTRAIADAPGLEEGLPWILAAIGLGLGWDWAAVWEQGREDGQLHCAAGWQSPRIDSTAFRRASHELALQPGTGLVGQVSASGRPVWISDLTTEAEFVRVVEARAAGLQAGMLLPLRSIDDAYSVLEVFSSEQIPQDDELFDLMTNLCSRIGFFIKDRQTEAEVRRLAQHNELILNTVGEGIYGLDRQGNATFFNAAGARMLGWEPEELVGQHLHSIIHHTRPDGTPYPTEECPISASLRAGISRHADDEVFWRRDGSSFPVEYISTPIVKGEETTGSVVVFQDISARKQAESERVQLLESITREQSTLAGVMASMTDGLVVLDQHRRVRYFNAQAGTLLKVDAVALVGQTAESAFAAFAGTVANPTGFWSDWSDALAQVEQRPGFEFTFAGPPRRDVMARLFAIDTLSGGDDYVGLLLYDVTAERDLARTKSELVAVVSHELRTPLASLVGFAELLLTRDYPEAQRQQFLGVILEEGNRLTALINDFLDLQRMESGRQRMVQTTTEVRSLLDRALAAAGPDPDHPITLNIPDGLPPVLADADRIFQVLSNLISNARKYSPGGGEIRLKASLAAGTVEISVCDHGLGLPPDALPQLFTKFYRVDNSDRRSIKGTGLGLAIAKQIVNAHGGHIWAESPGLGKGTCVRFTLPLVPEGTTAGDVLIVENDPGFAQLLEAGLSARGISVVKVTSVEDAIQQLLQMQPRGIVLDLLFPERGGEELLMWMQESKQCNAPVIVVTVKDLNAEERGALTRLGVQTILRKGPGVAPAVAEAVAGLLEAAVADSS